MATDIHSFSTSYVSAISISNCRWSLSMSAIFPEKFRSDVLTVQSIVNYFGSRNETMRMRCTLQLSRAKLHSWQAAIYIRIIVTPR